MAWSLSWRTARWAAVDGKPFPTCDKTSIDRPWSYLPIGWLKPLLKTQRLPWMFKTLAPRRGPAVLPISTRSNSSFSCYFSSALSCFECSSLEGQAGAAVFGGWEASAAGRAGVGVAEEDLG